MIIGIVIGNVWATKKEDALNGLKLMVVQRIDPADGKRHESLVAVDCVGELRSVHVIPRPHAEVELILPHRAEAAE